MKQVFYPADILLPKKEIDYTKWAVIACDQFTSEPEYWQAVKEYVDEAPSTLDLIFPEADLPDVNVHRIDWIHHCMNNYLIRDLFDEYRKSYVYVERTLADGSLRCGIVGMVDLEEYDYSGHSITAIRATEETVMERIPPRTAVRKNASLDVSHIILLCEDEKKELIEGVSKIKEELPLLYDLDLMEEGGHIQGRLLEKEAVKSFNRALRSYIRRQEEKYGKDPVCFLLGDGNHSLACAKDCYEEWKSNHPNTDTMHLPLRYALVELNNIYSYEQEFEPIHRLVRGVDPEKLLNELDCGRKTGLPVKWYAKDAEGTIYLDNSFGGIALGILQPLLDAYIEENGGEIDYIHGLASLKKTANEENTIGFELTAIGKDAFFENVTRYGVYPRKTFSIGEAKEKRYYMECRNII